MLKILKRGGESGTITKELPKEVNEAKLGTRVAWG
jgi:hypothetical protein